MKYSSTKFKSSKNLIGLWDGEKKIFVNKIYECPCCCVKLQNYHYLGFWFLNSRKNNMNSEKKKNERWEEQQSVVSFGVCSTQKMNADF
jgi:hypothetical protein